MEIDWKAVQARFSEMTREELLEEVALRAEEYTPQARRILEGEALRRGIDAAQIEERRKAEWSADDEPEGIDVPALLTSSGEREHVLELANVLRAADIPAAVRELDARAFQHSGHLVGRWGLIVPGMRAGDAARILETLMPAPERQDADAIGCGSGCGSCGGAADAAAGEEWPEDGDWWQTVPGEDDRGGERR